MGATNPADALPGTIRDYGQAPGDSGGIFNVVHGLIRSNLPRGKSPPGLGKNSANSYKLMKAEKSSRNLAFVVLMKGKKILTAEMNMTIRELRKRQEKIRTSPLLPILTMGNRPCLIGFGADRNGIQPGNAGPAPG